MNNTLKFDIQSILQLIEYNDQIVATDILPIIDETTLRIDDQAMADFNAFVENVYATLEYYDFELLGDFHHRSLSFPGTSEYRWIAHRSQLSQGDVPKYIKLRISDHFQNFSKPRRQELKKLDREQADSLKLPKTKKRQRYSVYEIVVNNEIFSSYEKALNFIDTQIFDWLEECGIDTSDYERLGW